MWLGIGEAVANLALSIVLVLTFRSVVSVAIGSLIPTLFFGWFKLWPWMARDIGIHPLRLLRETLLAPLLCCLPAVLILGIAPHYPPFQGSLLASTFLPGALAVIVTIWAIWQAALKSEERSAIRTRVPFFKSKNVAVLQPA